MQLSQTGFDLSLAYCQSESKVFPHLLHLPAESSLIHLFVFFILSGSWTRRKWEGALALVITLWQTGHSIWYLSINLGITSLRRLADILQNPVLIAFDQFIEQPQHGPDHPRMGSDLAFEKMVGEIQLSQCFCSLISFLEGGIYTNNSFTLLTKSSGRGNNR